MAIVTLKLIFWTCFFIVVYAYLAYGILLWFIIKLKRLVNGKPQVPNIQEDSLPEVTFVVAAYNEQDWIEDKIKNSLALKYPKGKLQFLYVTDGSNDLTPDLIRNYPIPHGVKSRLFHEDARRGKIAAVERIMEYIDTPIVVYTDANTIINPDAILNIARHYQDPKVGAVAGEKRVNMNEKDAANAAGEGFYWKYESTLKKWDSELYSVVGAAGELFSIRTALYEAVPQDTIIEDFYMTLKIAQKGYKVVYEPQAIAAEGSSASVKEELKRKIRIAAGGIQAIMRLTPLLNPFKYGLLSFQYISHRVLRWTLAPLALPIMFILSLIIALSGSTLFKVLFIGQVLFYGFAIIGYLLEKKAIKFKAFFIPYYFCVMNYAVYKGFGRIMNNNQSVVWEKAKRA